LVENFDLHKVRELAGERLDTLLQPGHVGLDLRPQQGLHAVVGELRPQFANRPGGIAKETCERHAHAGLRYRLSEVEEFVSERERLSSLRRKRR
jgi:hypothetical protein